MRQEGLRFSLTPVLCVYDCLDRSAHSSRHDAFCTQFKASRHKTCDKHYNYKIQRHCQGGETGEDGERLDRPRIMASSRGGGTRKIRLPCSSSAHLSKQGHESLQDYEICDFVEISQLHCTSGLLQALVSVHEGTLDLALPLYRTLPRLTP